MKSIPVYSTVFKRKRFFNVTFYDFTFLCGIVETAGNVVSDINHTTEASVANRKAGLRYAVL
jgi:hypothetical protein